MTKSREQRAADKKVDAAHKKALVAFADCETAKDDFVLADAVAKNAKDVARKADAVYFEAVKSSLAIDKAAYVAGKKDAPKHARSVRETQYPLSGKDDDDNDGYVCDENGTLYFQP